MTFTSYQSRIAYKKLPLDVQNLIMDNETTEFITNALKEIGLNEEQANLADSEILYAMYCLQGLTETIDNVAKLSGKSVNDLSKLKSKLQDQIFSKYTIERGEFIQANKAELEKNVTPTTGVTPATTNIKQNITPNLPMIEEGEVAHNVAPATSEVRSMEKEVGEEKSKIPLPDYRYDGKDPYREPLK